MTGPRGEHPLGDMDRAPSEEALPDKGVGIPLSGPSADAVDALIGAAWRVEDVPPELRAQAVRAMAIFSMLDGESAGLAGGPVDANAEHAVGSRTGSLAGSLASRVMDAIESSSAPASLSEADLAAGDEWVAAGFDVRAVSDNHRARAARHAAIASLLDGPHGSYEVRGELAERTALLIDLVERGTSDDAAPIPISRGERLRGRFWDVVAVAALVVVAASVMWPVMAGMRQRDLSVRCASNMQVTASAMSAYAGDFQDLMPVAVASLGPAGRWWDVNATRPVANSSNLYTLVRGGYTKAPSLACPGNPTAAVTFADPAAQDWRSLDEISYSYQLMYGGQSRRWSNSERRLVLADRSPAVLRAVRGERPVACENSPNHHGAGQHGLFTDGSAEWLSAPFVAGQASEMDCIWLPRPRRFLIRGTVEQRDGDMVITLTGRELPADGDDVFLGP